MSTPTINFPPGYLQALEAMRVEALRWVREHPCTVLLFDFQMGFPEGAFLIADLGACLNEVGQNEDTRAFLRALHVASGGKATHAMARAVVSTVFRQTQAPWQEDA